MKTIRAERITKENFAPYGKYINLYKEIKTAFIQSEGNNDGCDYKYV